jgi:hypothetical protein
MLGDIAELGYGGAKILKKGLDEGKKSIFNFNIKPLALRIA